MNPPARVLDVWLDDAHVGQLRDTGNVWALTYDDAWRARPDGFDLSPSLPRTENEIVDGASSRPVQWFFDNLLPEEDARALLATHAGITGADAFGLLEYYGRESAGALTLLPPGEQAPTGGLQHLSEADLSARIRNLPRVPLVGGAPKRMSMAGAQHKLAVVAGGSALWEPVGRTASTHILKPDHQDVDTYPHSVANEWFVMRLARAAGIPVPGVEMRHVPEPIFLVERFDRAGKPGHATRLHAIDGCQVLSLSPVFKYSQATAKTFARLVDACRRKAATRMALYRWAVFNLVVGNGDAHLKNLSFLAGSRGIDLAPHYDLVSTTVWRDADWANAELSTPMGAATRFAVVRRPDVQAFARELGLPEPLASRLLDELLGRIEAHARTLSEAHDAAPDSLPGEARLLRQIVHGPIVGMTRQLAS